MPGRRPPKTKLKQSDRGGSWSVGLRKRGIFVKSSAIVRPSAARVRSRRRRSRYKFLGVLLAPTDGRTRTEGRTRIGYPPFFPSLPPSLFPPSDVGEIGKRFTHSASISHFSSDDGAQIHEMLHLENNTSINHSFEEIRPRPL